MILSIVSFFSGFLIGGLYTCNHQIVSNQKLFDNQQKYYDDKIKLLTLKNKELETENFKLKHPNKIIDKYL